MAGSGSRICRATSANRVRPRHERGGREGTRLYWHGSSASRMVRAQAIGMPVCLTVTHHDALVLARSGFHPSVNYRCVMAYGRARPALAFR